jgi:hypothetical protein
VVTAIVKEGTHLNFDTIGIRLKGSIDASHRIVARPQAAAHSELELARTSHRVTSFLLAGIGLAARCSAPVLEASVVVSGRISCMGCKF